MTDRPQPTRLGSPSVCVATVAVLLAVVAAQAVVLMAVPPTPAAAKSSCPPGQKVCLTVGEPPAPGVYKFSKGSVGPNQSHAGHLSVGKRGHGYAVKGVRMWLGQKEGCGLNGQLATVEGSFPLVKKTKYFPLGSGKAERSLSWGLPHRNVKAKVGGKTYRGNLTVSFLGAPPGPGARPGVEGHLTLTDQEGAVCGGYFDGTHKGRS